MSPRRHLAERINDAGHALSHRVHAPGDAYASRHGWTVTETPGRFGLGVHVYRDHRFSQPSATPNEHAAQGGAHVSRDPQHHCPVCGEAALLDVEAGQ